MSTSNQKQLKQHRANMKAAGFRRISMSVSVELVALLEEQCQQGECRGRTLERLLLGKAVPRPTFPWTPEQRAQRKARQKRKQQVRLHPPWMQEALDGLRRERNSRADADRHARLGAGRHSDAENTGTSCTHDDTSTES